MAESENLDREKFALEKAKLDLEVRKFEADQPKRDLEIQKMAEDLREVRRPWFQKPAYVSTLSGLVIAVIGGLLAFGTNILNSNVVGLSKQRDELTRNVADLQRQEDALATEKKSLSAEKKNLTASNTSLQTEIRDAQKQRDDLALKADLAPLYDTINSLQEVEDAPTEAGSALADLLKTTKRRPEVLRILNDAYRNGKTSEPLRVAICLAIFKATGSLEWKDRLRRLSLDNAITRMHSAVVTGQLNYYSEFLGFLKDGSVFSLTERVQTLHELYSAALAVPRSFRRDPNLPFDPLYTVVFWDSEASTTYREPFFETLTTLYARKEWDKDQFNANVDRAGPELFWFSPQAFTVLLIDRLASLTKPVAPTIVSTPFDWAGEDCSKWFPADFPLSQDCLKPGSYPSDLPPVVIGQKTFPRLDTVLVGNGLSLRPARLPAYKAWAEKNPQLIAIWKDSSFQRLRVSRKETMIKILNREWIDNADLN